MSSSMLCGIRKDRSVPGSGNSAPRVKSRLTTNNSCSDSVATNGPTSRLNFALCDSLQGYSTAAELMARSQEASFVGGDYGILENEITLVCALPGKGKTALGYALAHALCSGGQIFGGDTMEYYRSKLMHNNSVLTPVSIYFEFEGRDRGSSIHSIFGAPSREKMRAGAWRSIMMVPSCEETLSEMWVQQKVRPLIDKLVRQGQPTMSIVIDSLTFAIKDGDKDSSSGGVYGGINFSYFSNNVIPGLKAFQDMAHSFKFPVIVITHSENKVTS
ncbi:hypothetical protein CEUSTIGMA_g13765.t1 [Chlamydomonas eustigma]|uniref:Uncharacterized protein n=1 Tax=Chlamydomonas eustigma TaxID=1157962 RepID=A0A250XTL1_9CHLO|nr:hypothetical protein CEUSTIGMA_g13765.t1 [Chlamydomonas eustigma]|eukprot:GAX86353.1 hypothetical protein CEUSTIGMA_g13765.t1 [Chlamydomonas eustigma]